MKHRTLWSVLPLIAVLAVGAYPLAAQTWGGNPGFPGSSEGEPSTEAPPTEGPGGTGIPEEPYETRPPLLCLSTPAAEGAA